MLIVAVAKAGTDFMSDEQVKRYVPFVSKRHLLEAMEKGCRFNGKKFVDTWSKRSSEWLDLFLPPLQRDLDAESVDDLANDFKEGFAAAIQLATQFKEQKPDNWPKLKRSVLAAALAEAATRLASEPRFGRDSLSLLNMRRGLQLYHVEIVQDDDTDQRPLDLSNGDFQFSLRLICCVIRVPLALSNLNLVTLDLSGSALVGVDGSFLRARGSVRLRNSYSSGPVDFTGAEIHGYFDASNVLVHPFGPLPPGQAISGDRGMLNLSQAHINNEVRLSGAKIFGGLSMRGLKTERSIFLQDSVLLSPLAMLEIVLHAKTQGLTEPDKDHLIGLAVRFSEKPTKEWQKLATAKKRTQEEEYRLAQIKVAMKCELFKIFNALWPNWSVEATTTPRLCSLQKESKINDLIVVCLDILMKESLRVRTSALRADGLKVSGSVFAQGLIGFGRLRLKYAEVAGSINLQGAELKSAEAQLMAFEKATPSYSLELTKDGYEGVDIQICRYRKATYLKIIKEASGEGIKPDDLAPGADDYALDLRESRFGGAVRIGIPEGERISGHKIKTTKIDGVVAIERATIHSDLIMDGTEFKWACRIKSHNWKVGENESSQVVDFKAACDDSAKVRNKEVEGGHRFNVDATGLVVGGDVNRTGFAGGSKT